MEEKHETAAPYPELVERDWSTKVRATLHKAWAILGARPPKKKRRPWREVSGPQGGGVAILGARPVKPKRTTERPG